ncbi:MAG: leucine-rich repeat domain-containing protein, partial [Oscillospiraceae bacterium]|nr:leucine-rich repeat domain-containing protein [Oscillospiraceae bacterium]
MKQRKIITWVLVLLMALSLFSVAALADEAEETGSEEIAEETASEEPTEETASEEIVEETSSNALVLTTALTAASGNGWELDDNGKLTISSDTGMSNWASSRSTYAEKVTSVEIASGVTSISASAFANCSNLTAITIPASVKSIGNNAF